MAIRIVGSSSANTLRGTSATELFYGLAGNDLFIGSYGNDVIDGGEGSDTVDYSGYNGAITVSLNGSSQVRANGAFGEYHFLSNVENLILGGGNDVVRGDVNNNAFWGNGGNDTFLCSGGHDFYDGGTGFDTVDYTKAGIGITVKFTSANIATISTNGVVSDKLANIEKIIGSDKADTFYGSSANNTFVGGAGDDRFYCSAGTDKYDGGAGIDTVDYTKAGTGLTFKFTSANTAIVYSGGVASDTLANIEHIIGSAKSDTFYGSTASNTFTGGAGDDRFYCSGGYDIYNGDTGIDTVDYTKAGIALTIKATGADSATVASNGVVSDKLFSIENIIGSNYGDNIAGTQVNNVINGGAGNDTLHGGAGNDTLIGGTGNDTITGGMGNDFLTGGAGSDTFLFGTYEGKDTITDFQATGTGFDIVKLNGRLMGIDSFADIMDGGYLQQSGADVVLYHGKGDMVTLKGVDLSDLSASNFLFI